MWKVLILALVVALVFTWAFKPGWYKSVGHHLSVIGEYIWNALQWVLALVLLPFDRYRYNGAHRLGGEGLYYVLQRQAVREVIGA